MAAINSVIKALLRKLGYGPGRRDFFAGSTPVSDQEFVAQVYRQFLDREADPAGLQHYVQSLADGLPRLQVIQQVVSGDEHLRRLLRQKALTLPALKDLRPDKFVEERLRGSREKALAFLAAGPADLDWLEQCISEYGYYDAMGVWWREADQDKQVIADQAAAFAPARVLEIGCFSGAVLELLAARGVVAEGVEVSHLALTLAPHQVRARIHFGDLRELRLPGYDLILGMDVFEHLNPRSLPGFLGRCAELLAAGGYLLSNIPAYGPDPVFGEIHPYYFERWDQCQEDGLFTLLHVDTAGWPISGHLTWATSEWWQRLFNAAGLVREPGIERALHGRWDGFFKEQAPARRSFYVFSKDRTPAQAQEIIRRVAGQG